MSVTCTSILIRYFTPLFNYDWFATFLSDDCAHHMKLKVTDFVFIIWYFSGLYIYFAVVALCTTWKLFSFLFIFLYKVHMISFQTFFVWAFKIVVDSWKFSMLLLYILWDDWPIFMISGFKWTATAGIGIHPTNAWLSQLVNFKNAIWHFRRTICNKILF